MRLLGFGMEWALGGIGLIRNDLALVLRLVLALAVTVHVLLRKREVGSAFGWIGLAWITPIVGSVLYFLLGINRVQRRARQLRSQLSRPRGLTAAAAEQGGQRDDHLAPLEHAVGRITGRQSLPGNTLVPLHNGEQAYPRMLAAIEQAERTLLLSTYILRDDAAGAPFIDALIAAQVRGVAVRVLVDGVGSGYFLSPAYHRLHRAGVPVARFMHSLLPWRMPFLNLRTHQKVLVADGRVAFTGGMNIGAENLVASNPPHPVRDTHFAVSGPVVAQLVECFAQDWQSVTSEELDGDAWFPSLAEAGPATARVVNSGPDQDIEKIESVAGQAIACARHSIRIATPYFLPDERLITALSGAALRGVKVEVVTPSASNHRYVDWATSANTPPLLAAGVRLWHSAAPFDHSKLMVVDDEWSLVGSANWDMRSFRLNFELTVEVYNADFAAIVTEAIRSRRHTRVTAADLDARPVAARLRDAAMRLMLPYL